MYAKFPEGAAQRTDPAAAAEVLYDAVVVGGGIAGALIAARLSDAGKRVLILEGRPGRGPHPEGLRELPRPLLLGHRQGQPVPLPGRRRRPDAPRHRRTPHLPGRARRLGLPRPERALRHRHHVHPGPRRHHHALGGQDAADAPRGLPYAHALRRGGRLAAHLRGPRPLLQRGRTRDRRLRRRRGPGLPRDHLRRGLRVPHEGTAPVVPGPDGRGGPRRDAGRTRRRTARVAGPALPAGAQRHTEPGLRRRQGLPAARRGEHVPGRGRRAVPGQQQLRAHLPGAGQVPQPARRSRRPCRAAGSTWWPRRWPTRCTSTSGPAG
ncbi:NAD(P)-binding protein [Streptomyces lasalocidi]